MSDETVTADEFIARIREGLGDRVADAVLADLARSALNETEVRDGLG